MNGDSLNPVEIICAPDAKHKTASRQFQCIPGVAMSPGGCLFVAWYSGGVNEGPENFAVLAPAREIVVVLAQLFSVKDGTISDGANGLWAIFAP